jgi:two-component system sensor histidine kinase DesK
MQGLAGIRDRSARPTHFLWLMWAIWLPYLAYPISRLLAVHPSTARLFGVLTATALFVAVYLWTAWRFVTGRASSTPSAAAGSATRWLPLVVLAFLSLALCLVEGKDWLGLFIYTSAVVGICLPLRTAALVLAGLALLSSVVGLIEQDDGSGIGQTIFIIAVTGFSVISLVWLIATNRALQVAREEIARLAVSEERLRFARDLHDLLGHSLSLIALKSELAGRLATVAPERAATEMRDVESVARKALQEVRTAVAGYRQPTLASELQGAQEILAAAGISYIYEGESVALSAATEAVLSWAVREGVTNVIRHSRARRCTIRLTHNDQQVGVSVIDDGLGAPANPMSRTGEGSAGSGLAGLAERVEALGGRCESGALPGGGFRLTVTLPMEGGPDVGDVPAPRADIPVETARSA